MRTLWLCVGLMLFSLSVNGAVVTEQAVRVLSAVSADPRCPLKDIKPTRVQLKTILANHQKWIYKNEEKIKNHQLTIEDNKDPLRANLCKADLTGVSLKGLWSFRVNLAGANLGHANLANANLSNVILTGAILSYANFTGANLEEANLTYANLEYTNFTNANLTVAILAGANLGYANLTNANLSGANLTKAHLRDTNLTGAYFANANLANTVFDIKSVSLPRIETLVDNATLDKMNFTTKTGLVELRKKFYDSGYTNEGKKISKVLKYRDNEKELSKQADTFTRLDGLFNFVFFELPTDWGVEPGRALKILLFGIVFFMFFYLVALQAPEQPAGVWKIRAKERLLEKDLADEELIRPADFWHALLTAFYFSLLSAFHFGWRDLNVGSWIVRLQRKEHTYRATGWVRTVAGVQSLMSVYLVAMWALTYFGHPFD